MSKQNSADLTELSLSKQTAAKTLFAAFEALKAAGGELPRKEMIKALEDKLTFTDWEQEIYKSNNTQRWLTIFFFYTIDARKSGFLRKEKSMWYLTKEGEEAMEKGPVQLLETASAGYRKWASENKSKTSTNDSEEVESAIEEQTEQAQEVNLELLIEQALNNIHDFIARKNPYEFQDMAAALLQAMGYYVSHVAPKGKDGGIDIIAYQDPLGIKTPRIKVQVKHWTTGTVGTDPIKILKSLVNSGEEIGLFITNSTYSRDAERFAREANIHIKLIDGDEFIELWREHYHKLTDEQKNMLPLQAIYFLGSNE